MQSTNQQFFNSPKRRIRLDMNEIKKAVDDSKKPYVNTNIPSPTDPFIMTPRNKR